MPLALMEHAVDPREALLDKIGSLDGIEVFNNQVLVAIYQRPEKTAGGIILTDDTRKEDIWQGKVGLILKMGASAFQDPSGAWFQGVNVDVGDWIWFRPSHGFQLTVNSRDGACRLFKDTDIAGVLPHPDMIW